MSRTITAMFDSRSDAEAGLERVKACGIDTDQVRIHDQATSGSASEQYSTTDEPGIWASIKNAFLPDEDRHTYEEGVRRGGVVLSADVDEDRVDDAVKALEDANSVDIDERSNQWRSEGWTPPAGQTAMFGKTARSQSDDHIDVIREDLVVGKREVERGGARVRSFVTEVPVHEQVRLRDERVEVERRPVDRELSSTDGDPFRERTIEMTETDEEAVVGKRARVVEEIDLRKTTDERVETIDDTVRRTEVEVENLSDTDAGRSRGAAQGRDAGTTAAGIGNEAMGNVKQGFGKLTGNEELERRGEAQERTGEQQQGKKPEGY